jgi:heat shock protein HtpX
MFNFFKTTILLGLLTGVVVAFGYYYGGAEWAVAALAFAAVMNFVSYWFSDRIVLAMYGARRAERGDSPRLYGIVERLAGCAGLPMPKVYIIPDASPNAFATGRGPSHAAVAATSGILNLLNDDELAGVMAHELAHVKHRDTLIGTVAATIAGAISVLARILMFGNGRDRNRQGGGIGTLLMVILAPMAAMLIQMAISRSREYAADAAGARICGKPVALASALTRLESGVRAVPMDDMGGPATSHLFIVNPFRGGFMAGLFSTHPPTEERVRRLRAM